MPKIIINIREQILESAKIMLLEGNYTEFNIRNLANKCGLGLGTLYNYFLNKDELVYHIFKTDSDRTLVLIDDLKSEDLPFREKLKAIFNSLETFIGQYMSIFKEMAGGELNRCPNNHCTELYGKMQELIEVEKKKGKIGLEVESGKLSYFLITNIIYCIRDKYMTFDEFFNCIRI